MMKVLGRRGGTPVDMVVGKKPSPVSRTDPTGLMGMMQPVEVEGTFGSDPGTGNGPVAPVEKDRK